MTDKRLFVALKAFRFGTEDLQPGDPVPVEAGRDYRLMQRLGQIGPASVTAPAEPQEDPSNLVLRLPTSGRAVWVGEHGDHEAVTFLGVEEAPAEALEGLGVPAGTRVALVSFPDDPENGTFVPLGSLLPEQPTLRLIERFASQLQEAKEGHAAALTRPSPQQEQEATALRGQVAFLELLVQAIRAEGDPLPDDFPAVKELRANGVTTQQGLLLLAEGEQGKANLVSLDGIGGSRADRILAALFPPADPPTNMPSTPEA